jgi:hypothetical protein
VDEPSCGLSRRRGRENGGPGGGDVGCHLDGQGGGSRAVVKGCFGGLSVWDMCREDAGVASTGCWVLAGESCGERHMGCGVGQADQTCCTVFDALLAAEGEIRMSLTFGPFWGKHRMRVSSRSSPCHLRASPVVLFCKPESGKRLKAERGGKT